MVKAKKVVDNVDGVAYTKAQFVEFYGEKKADKIWESADRRAAVPGTDAKAKAKGGKAKKVVDKTDGVAYTLAQFVEFYGEKKANKIFEAAEKSAPVSEPKAKGGKAKKVVDKADGVAYTKAQFVEFYGETKANKIFEAADRRAAAPEPKAKAKAKAKAKGRADGGDAGGGAVAKKKAAPKKERPPRQLATEGEIPIKRVARVYRATVKDEEGALKLDALANDVQTKLRENRKEKAKGFVKLVRMVCKTEWAVEVNIIWGSFDDFTAYKESEFRKEVSGEFEAKIKDIITGDFYTGVRVYDEL